MIYIIHTEHFTYEKNCKKFRKEDFFMKKKLALLLAVGCMMTSSITAFAAGHDYKFTFTSKGQKLETASYAKADNEQNAYVTVIEDTYENFIDDEDAFGCRVRKATNDVAVTDYTVIRTTDRYKLPYTSTGYKGTSYYLRGQIDSSGDYNVLTVMGRWVP